MKWSSSFLSLLFILFISCATTLNGCSTTSVTRHSIDPTRLKDLETLTQTQFSATQSSINNMRADALKEIAMTLGAQAGLAWRTQQINQELTRNQRELSRIFNFNELILDQNVLPAVIQESKQSLQLNGPDIIRTAHRTYKIVKQAKFVTAPPHWREYLWLDYQAPELPHQAFLPRNKEERTIWVRSVDLGWKKGVEQADNIHRDNFARLKSDFAGMLLYRKLLAQHMVTQPFVAEADLGITTNVDRSEVRIHDKILRITATPELNSNEKQWKPVVVVK